MRTLRFELMLQRFLVFLEVFFCTVERQALLLHQVVNDLQGIHILRRKQTVTLLVLFRLQHVKLLFPKANQRSVHIEHLGYFTNGVV